MKNRLIILIVCLIYANMTAFAATRCHPRFQRDTSQYIVGYGSLMNETSKKRTHHEVQAGLPILVKGFKRGWYVHGDSPGPDTTFLGIIPEPNSQMNAVIFRLNKAKILTKYDHREKNYCRILLKPKQIKLLTHKKRVDGQVWAYSLKKAKVQLPDKGHPIVQSYVDLFLSGCLMLEKKHNLKDFAKQCVTTTHAWSKHWSNDRLHPRRPFAYEPYAFEIDALLSKLVPEQFKQITV